MNNTESGSCIGCNEETDSDRFCFGCKAFICGDCVTNDISGFGHEPDAHLLLSDCCNAGILEGYCNACNSPAFE